MTFRPLARRTPSDPVTIGLSAAAVGLIVLGVTGCTGIQRVLQHEHEESYATYAEADDDWVGVPIPTWIPQSATDLRNLATTNEQVSVVRVATSDDLAGDCEPADRHGLPALTADWTPTFDDSGLPDTVMLCGDYEVIPVVDGWVGWFNATEPGDTPG